LGSIKSGSGNNVALPLNAATDVCNTGTLGSGIWVISGSVNISLIANATQLYIWLNTSSAVYTNALTQISYLTASSGSIAYSISHIINTSGTIYLSVQQNGSGSATIMSGNIIAVRVG